MITVLCKLQSVEFSSFFSPGLVVFAALGRSPPIHFPGLAGGGMKEAVPAEVALLEPACSCLSSRVPLSGEMSTQGPSWWPGSCEGARQIGAVSGPCGVRRCQPG